MDLPFYREYELPWSADSSQERKFQRLLGMVFLVVLVLGLVWPFLPAPEREFDLTVALHFVDALVLARNGVDKRDARKLSCI